MKRRINGVLLLAAAILALLLYIQYRKKSARSEAFSVELKTSVDGKMFKNINNGAHSLIGGIGSQAKKISYTINSILPFKHKIREWKRKMRRRNM
jgi:hypothetical protein